jgi:hypothetical protein
MSRYYFHIRDGEILVPDEEGTECRDMIAVQEEARASVRDLYNVAIPSFSLQPLASIEIEDEDGNAVEMLPARSRLH